jgi:hypothetical protein
MIVTSLLCDGFNGLSGFLFRGIGAFGFFLSDEMLYLFRGRI